MVRVHPPLLRRDAGAEAPASWISRGARRAGEVLIKEPSIAGGNLLNSPPLRAEIPLVSTRYCPTCATEVEDADGFCLLGHSLRVSAITDSMDELRAEVDHAFATARAELAAMNGRGPAASQAPAQRPPAPPGPAGRPESGPSTPPSPPPPPPTNSDETTMPSVWQAFEHELAGAEPIESGDPISMFAPSPRMDWGPEKTARFRRPTLRRPSGASA